MPALITHRLFGEESIERLPKGLITSDDERAAFLLANQGPDPFFFRVRTPHMGTCMELARVMHRSRMSKQLAALRDGVTHLQPADAGVGPRMDARPTLPLHSGPQRPSLCICAAMGHSRGGR